MHVAMITREFPPNSGGIGYYVYYLSKNLCERGYKISIITRGSFKKTTKEELNGIDIYRASFIPLFPFHIFIHGVFVKRLLESMENELDLVHMHSPLTPPVKTTLPIITTVHSPSRRARNALYHETFDLVSFAERCQSMFIYPSIETKLFEISNKITTVSSSVGIELKEYGLNPKEISVIGNGVDENLFKPIRSKKSKEDYVLYVGSLKAGKGLLNLINCGYIISKIKPKTKFIICGSGPLLQILKKRVKRLNLQKQFLFLGLLGRDRLVRIYQKAAIQVIPSQHEGLPTVLLEGMSCGLPVIATNVGGNNEVINSGENGFLIPPNDPLAMANIIYKLLDDMDLRKRIGYSARRTIENKYTWDKITDNIIQCYNDI